MSMDYSYFFQVYLKKVNLTETCRVSADDSEEPSYVLKKGVERNITAVFNLLFEVIPNTISQYMHIAADYDADIFEKAISFNKKALERSMYLKRPLENGLSRISRVTSITPDDLTSMLNHVASDKTHFTHYLINRNFPKLLCAIENVMYANRMSLSFSLPKANLKDRFIASLLHDCDASYALINSITGLHYSTLHKMWPDDICKNSKARARNSGMSLLRVKRLKALVEKPDMNAIIMLMLALYTITNRVLLEELPTSNHFDQEDLPLTVSNSLAVGVYIASRDVMRTFDELNHHNLSTMTALHARQSFPKFDDFYDILLNYVERKIHILGCAFCHTPYIDFSPLISELNGKTLLNESSLCPNCHHSAGYELCENEGEIYENCRLS